MNATYYILIIVLFSFFMLGRYISSGAAKLLSDEEKVLLVDFSIQRRKLSFPIMILAIAVIFISSNYAILLFFGIVVCIYWYQHWKLKSMGFPKDYRNRLLLGSVITIVGIGIPLLYSIIY